ncbi:MAG: dienelactone hydrolase family protein [Gammaproteobacteria bacterium]|nr:dienelactone hydrolase family protein [Gammaproteobacteria bacterium]
MGRVITSLLGLMLFVAPLGGQAAIVGEEVSYTAGGTTMKGYIAYDDSLERRRPGVLVVHEWWGHNDYARIRARKLARLGYTAMAVDMYGNGQQADHPKQAGAFASKIRQNLPLMKERFKAAMEILKDHDTVLNNRIAAIGYCFGGAVVLEMARQGERLKGVVSFHGSLTTQSPARKNQVKAEILVLHGAADPFTPREQVEAFKEEMEKAGVKYRFVEYEGAKHAFTNPRAEYLGNKFGIPLAYHAEADEASWKEMRRFLDKVLY